MSSTQKPAGSDDEREGTAEGQMPPTPDEGGPHDVPDDKVIEKTLPKSPASGGREGGSAP